MRACILTVLVAASTNPAGAEVSRAVAPQAADAPPPIPERAPTPFAVVPFRLGKGDAAWMRLGLPFFLAEMAEAHPGLRPVYGPLVVPPRFVEDGADSVARWAAGQGAHWVFGGATDRKGDVLTLRVVLWRVADGQASQVGVHETAGPRDNVARRLSDAVIALSALGGVPVPDSHVARVGVLPSRDVYALTLLGRALTQMTVAKRPRDYEPAYRDLVRATVVDPGVASTHRLLAELHLRVGRNERAVVQLLKAIGLRRHYSSALSTLARAERLQGNLAEARRLFFRLLKKRPWDLEARKELGLVLWDMGDAEGACRELGQVTKYRPDDERTRRALVLCHAARGQHSALVAELEQVVRLAPNDVEARLDLAAAYAAGGSAERAKASYLEVLARDKRNLPALKFLGDLYSRTGELDRATDYYERAVKAKPKDPRAYFLLAAAYAKLGQDEDARRIYKKAQRFKKFKAETWNNLGALAYRQGKWKRAAKYLRKAVRKRPKNARYRYNFALSLSKRDRRHLALEQIEAGLEQEPDSSELHYLRGVIELKYGRLEAARAAFKETLRLMPDHGGARHNLAQLAAVEQRDAHGEVARE